MSSDDNKEFLSALEGYLASFGIPPLSDAQIGQLSKHYAMLREWNRRMNLTRIIEPRQAARLHYAECLFGGRFIGEAETLLDVGSGAGFPAIPLAVMRPDATVTALEANQKKALFLSEAKDALALDNLKVARARLEQFDWERFDLIASRALDRAEEVFGSVIAALNPHQRLMLYCAPDLLAKFKQQAGERCMVEAHPIPESESRLIAIFRASVKKITTA